MNERYPIGTYVEETNISIEMLEKWVAEITAFPDKLAKTVQGLNEEQLDTPYRDGGWTIRQVVHHLADSHMNAYIRTKLALTENKPTIKPYEEAGWAELADYSLPIEVSLSLLSNLHTRFVYLLKSQLKSETIEREFYHPENGVQTIKGLIGNYAWHGRHHLAHITNICEKKGWMETK